MCRGYTLDVGCSIGIVKRRYSLIWCWFRVGVVDCDILPRHQGKRGMIYISPFLDLVIG